MKDIVLYPTKIVITNYQLGDCQKLERSLSVWDPQIFKVVFEGFIYDEEKRELTIPRGFNLQYLEALFCNNNPQIAYNIDYSKKDIVEPYNTVRFSLKFPTRDSLQNEATRFLQNTGNQKFLSLGTGKGKTYCAIYHIFKSKKVPLTFVDQESIANQWKDRILYFTTIKEEEVYMISGQKSMDKLLSMTDKEIKKYKWYIGIHRTFSNYLENNGTDKLNKFFKKIKLGCRLYDEAHVEYKNIFNMDMVYSCESVYITATPSRSNPNENKVYQNMFSEKTIPRFVGNGENYQNVIIFKYNTNPELYQESMMVSKYGFNVVKWNDYIMNDKIEIFTEALEKIFNNVYKTNKHKTVILVKSIDMCNYLYEDFKEYFEDKELTIGKYHSKIKNNDKELEKDVIFTTEKSFGKALDLPGLSVCINTVPCSSETVVTQIMGRLRQIPDKEVFFVDMYDEGFSAQCKQASKRIRIYKNKAKKIYYVK